MKKILIIALIIMIPFITVAAAMGDVDGNGTIESRDLLLMKLHILNKEKLTGEPYKRANVDEIEGVTSSDFLIVKKAYMYKTPVPVTRNTNTTTPTAVKNKVKYNDINQVVTIEKGSKLGALPTAVKKGFNFDGWYTSATGGTKVSSSTIVNKDMTLYAHYSAIYKYVFIIGIDGLGATFKKVSSPNFDKIFKNYAFRYNVGSESKTSSAPNWTSILSGVKYGTHNITNNVAETKERTSKTKYPTIFTYIRKAMPKAKLVSIVNWDPINYGIVENDINVKKIETKTDKEVVSKVQSYLDSNKPTLMFVHLDEVDAAAHKTAGNCSTCGGFSSKYYDAAKTADTQLGTIYNKIKSAGILDDSLIIVVADHGETKTAHGGNTKEEKEVMLAVRGKTVNKMTFDDSVHNRDVAAIVLYALGIEKPSNFVAKVPNGLFNK